MKTTVVNCKYDTPDVYIGRPSRWGNPYKITNDLDRDAVIELFRTRLLRHIEQGRVHPSDLLELAGKRLGCWCKPRACHGDVLAEFADRVAAKAKLDADVEVYDVILP